jgi:hypothetical protein
MAEAALTLYQAEWCPFSSAVREVLTELGLDFVARQVEPWPGQRAMLREVAGTNQIGLAAYRRRNGRISFTHTEVEESCEGRSFGSRLAAAALEDARRQGLDVVPLCPFIAHYIERHPEYEQLVASGYRDR